jgi:hypothetical protein
MENMSEIAGTGFFFSRNGDGSMAFARGMGEEMEELDPDTFAAAFGSSVEDQDARKQAQGILQELNSSKRMNLTLAPFENRATESQQEMNSVLGGMMGGM